MEKAVLVCSYPSGGDRALAREYLEELGRLCDTYGIQAVAQIACPIKHIDAGMYLGLGKLEEIKIMASDVGADLIVFDEEISPRQQKNLEGFFKKPVIDRTELILGIFAKRARTLEARLQIEVAEAKYQFPRLKRLWTHLSRQSTGGGGYLKGEGEKQIEIDKRLLRRRIQQLEKELKEVREQRKTQRAARMRSAVPTFAIIGYTNAGKSTLLKALTQADVLVEDKLFATLDTTTRKYTLPNKQEVLLIDTVGFIRKIPHTLVEAFKSTLEEAAHTDVLLHLIDVSADTAELQAETTCAVLKELGVGHYPVITVLNKIDACTDLGRVHKLRIKYPKTVAISALDHSGIDELAHMMMEEIASLRLRVALKIPQSHYALVSLLMREARVITCVYEENDILLEVDLPKALEKQVHPFIRGKIESV